MCHDSIFLMCSCVCARPLSLTKSLPSHFQPGSCAVKKTILRVFGHDLIGFDSLINTARSAAAKTHGFFFLVQRQARNFENVTLVARRRKHLQGFLATLLVAQLPPKRGIFVHNNSLASCQWYRHIVESRALTCAFKQSNLSVWCGVDTSHIHTLKGDSILYKLLAPHCHGHAE